MSNESSRFADKYIISNNTEFRILYKAYGIRILIRVIGQAGRFSVLRLTHAIGTGMGLFAIASLVSDFVMLNFLTNKRQYKGAKEIQLRNSRLGKLMRQNMEEANL